MMYVSAMELPPSTLLAAANSHVIRRTPSVSISELPTASAADARSIILKRDMSDGAIAGTVIGVVVAVTILAICLYPVIVYLLRRRRRESHWAPDVEATGGHQTTSAHDGRPSSHRRGSSAYSFKRDGDLVRGDFNDVQQTAVGWKATDVARIQGEGNLGRLERFPTHIRASPPWRESTTATTIGETLFEHDGAEEEVLFPFYMPASMPDENPGVLKGTSADYYSPSIPSEAFGMVTIPEVFAAERITPRGGSFRHSVKQVFRRQSSRESSQSKRHSDEVEQASPAVNSGTRPSGHYDTEHPVDSLVATTSTLKVLAPDPSTSLSSEKADPPSLSHLPPEAGAVEHPSTSALINETVNPMDIMPASTESEMRHRTAHELLGSYCAENQAQDAQNTPTTTAHTPIPASKLSEASQKSHLFALTDQCAITELQGSETQQVPVINLHASDALSPSLSCVDSGSARSNRSTPCPASHSTESSTEDTPSTMQDSPSPSSIKSQDCRLGASPQTVFQSSETGLYHCDVLGCSRTFQQLHKLRHHQRYHLKNHRCPYTDCSKGFGTKTHLQRHINDRHLKKKKFHCIQPGCEYSRAGGKAFPRKDNWKRHMTRSHNVDPQHLPTPEEVDSEMTGM